MFLRSVFVLLTLAACARAQPSGTPVPVYPMATELKYVDWLRGNGPAKPGPLVARDSAAWVTIATPLFNPILPVDFSRDMVIGYALGARGHLNGPWPHIAAARLHGDTLVVNVDVTNCLPDGPTDDGGAAPVSLARTPQYHGPIVFITTPDRCPTAPPYSPHDIGAAPIPAG